MLIKGIYILLWMVLMPFSVGLLILRGTKRSGTDLLACFFAGYLGIFGLFEIFAVPMILLKLPFHILVNTMTAVFGILTAVAWMKDYKDVVMLIKKAVNGMTKQPWTIWAALIFIVIQIAFYVLGMATDLDDAYYVAAAGTAMETDTMFCVSPYTGQAVSTLNWRYVFAPFPMLTAFFSKKCGFEAATMAHTILPVFLVSLAYIVYYRLGLLLFHDKEKEEQERKKAAGLFLCFLSLVHISSYYSVYTQGTFLLIRIWQGKAVLSAVLLPFLFYMGYKAMSGRAEKGDWGLLFLGELSCCLVSSMGVVLAPVLTGILALLFGAFKKKWSYVGRSIICCLPCVAVGILYLMRAVLK